MKALRRGFTGRQLVPMIGFLAVFSGTLPAQSVVVGTGSPDVDVPAVQAAVDQGGSVVLTGHFSFDRPPTTPDGATYNRTVTVSRSVIISGNRDRNGDLPTVAGGDWPFFIDAAGSQVTIQGLHFVNPTSGAIWIYAVAGVEIVGCRVQGIIPSVEFAVEAGQAGSVSTAIFAGADPHPPSRTALGQPANFSGTMKILNNEIDLAGIAGTLALGIAMFSVGSQPDSEVDIDVSGNKIINATEPAINFRIIGGRVYVERNVVRTGSISGGAANPDAIRLVGAGSYLVAHNSVDCGWPDAGATGINVIGQPSPLVPETGAVVVDNDITMSAPAGTVFSAGSAAIEIRGFAGNNSILNNRIRGRANAGLSLLGQNGGLPGNNSLVSNDLRGFQSSLADIFVDAGATNTFVIGHQATMADNGSGTVVVPMR
jgi:hypothetical protein